MVIKMAVSVQHFTAAREGMIQLSSPSLKKENLRMNMFAAWICKTAEFPVCNRLKEGEGMRFV